jgi:hypothetical protein
MRGESKDTGPVNLTANLPADLPAILWLRKIWQFLPETRVAWQEPEFSRFVKGNDAIAIFRR